MSHAVGQAVDQRRIANVALDAARPARGHGLGQILVTPTDEVVEHDDARGAGLEQLIGDVGAHEAGATRDKHVRATQVERHREVLLRMKVMG